MGLISTPVRFFTNQIKQIIDSDYNSSAVNSARQDGRAVSGARLKRFSKMRILVHDFVHGFESYSCHFFEQFPIKIKCLAFYWSAAYSARQDSQAVKGSRFKTL